MSSVIQKNNDNKVLNTAKKMDVLDSKYPGRNQPQTGCKLVTTLKFRTEIMFKNSSKTASFCHKKATRVAATLHDFATTSMQLAVSSLQTRCEIDVDWVETNHNSATSPVELTCNDARIYL